MPALTITDQDDRSTAIENYLARLQPSRPFVELRSSEQMTRLTRGPRPSDAKVVALLLERWTTADPKPTSADFGGTSAFLRWATQRVGPAGFASLFESDRGTARRFAQAFLGYANGEITRCQSRREGGTIAAATRTHRANSWIEVKRQILGEVG